MADDLATQWRGLNPDQREQAMSRMSPEQKRKLADALGFGAQHNATVSAAPGAFTVPWMKEKAYSARNWLIDQLPAAGGIAGGLIGATSGAETGPGAAVSAAAGAAAGGGLGEDLRQTIYEHLYPDEKMGPKESALRIAAQAGLQGANEVTGQVAGRAASGVVRHVADTELGTQVLSKYPFLKSFFGVRQSPQAAQHLTAASSAKDTRVAGTALKAIGRTMDDLTAEMEKLPPQQRTIQGFRDAVNTRKDDMNREYSLAMMPIASHETVPFGVSQKVKDLIRAYMDQTKMGKAQRAYLEKRAAEFEKPWTFAQLDALRTDLGSQLAKHNVKGSVAKYTAEKGDLDLAVDNAVLDGLRESVYPAMDQAAGKPAGYFEDMKGRQSSLISLQSILDTRIEDLAGKQAISEVTPRFGTENVSASGHVGRMPRVGVYGIRQALSPPRELDEASKHVRRAFVDVNSLPYTTLLSTATRAAEVKGPMRQKLEQIKAVPPAPTRAQHIKKLRDTYQYTDASQQ